MSTGHCYPVPFEMLDPMPSTDDPVVHVSQDNEEIRYALRCGKAGSEDVDHILSLNQSPEHLNKMLEFWRRYRRQSAL